MESLASLTYNSRVKTLEGDMKASIGDFIITGKWRTISM